MLLWLALLIIIITTAFLLAFFSMRDFKPSLNIRKNDFGLFLVRNKGQINMDFLNLVYDFLTRQDSIFSIERLVKGKESALVIFGSKAFLLPQVEKLGLLELEDYVDSGSKNRLDREQLWWQAVLQPFIAQKKEKMFRVQIRIVGLFAGAQIIETYKNRSFTKEETNPILTFENVLRLIFFQLV